MYSLIQSLHIKGNAGDPLPVVWDTLHRKGTDFLRGQLCLICAGPGTGKSAFVLTYALKAQIPTLYFSADSDAFTQLTRTLSITSGMSAHEAADLVRSGNLGDASSFLESIPIRFNYNASPSLDQIELSMMAYDEVYGDYPALVVVDNITNVRGVADDDEDPFSGLESMMDYLHTMARQTSACVIGLHHVTGKYNDGNVPIPLSGVKGQITRVPEMVLTLHRVSSEFGSDRLNVSTVKNRGGRQDPSGMDFASLEFRGGTMTIKDSTS